MEEQNRDIYYSILPMVKKITDHWAESHPRKNHEEHMIIFASLIGVAFIMLVYLRIADLPKKDSWMLHVAIWIAFLFIYFFGRHKNLVVYPPFRSVVNARFEMSDDGIHYFYQRRMKVFDCFIRDDDIREMILDTEAKVLYIRGRFEITPEDSHGKGEPVIEDEMYCLLPFDKYDVDDILAPYGDAVKKEPGTLRMKYIEEHK
jgi:hypothetical protein